MDCRHTCNLSLFTVDTHKLDACISRRRAYHATIHVTQQTYKVTAARKTRIRAAAVAEGRHQANNKWASAVGAISLFSPSGARDRSVSDLLYSRTQARVLVVFKRPIPIETDSCKDSGSQHGKHKPECKNTDSYRDRILSTLGGPTQT